MCCQNASMRPLYPASQCQSRPSCNENGLVDLHWRGPVKAAAAITHQPVRALHMLCSTQYQLGLFGIREKNVIARPVGRFTQWLSTWDRNWRFGDTHGKFKKQPICPQWLLPFHRRLCITYFCLDSSAVVSAGRSDSLSSLVCFCRRR